MLPFIQPKKYKMSLTKIILKENIYASLKGIGYHVTNKKNVNNILKKGLKNEKNYIWLYDKYAEWFKEFHEDSEGNSEFEILEVELEGFDWIYDEETKDMSVWSSVFSKGENGHGYFTMDNIPPHKIKL